MAHGLQSNAYYKPSLLFPLWHPAIFRQSTIRHSRGAIPDAVDTRHIGMYAGPLIGRHFIRGRFFVTCGRGCEFVRFGRRIADAYALFVWDATRVASLGIGAP